MECQEHEGETTLVCVTCDNKLLCPQCFDDHTKGHDIQSVIKVGAQIKKDLNDLSETYSQHESDVCNNISVTLALQEEQEVRENQACKKISTQRQMLHRAIDESADNLEAICKQQKQKNLSALRDREKLLSSKTTEITKIQSEIKKLLQSKNIVDVIKSSKIVKSMKVNNIPPKSLESFHFHISQISKQRIDTMLHQMVGTPAGDDFVGSVHSEGELSTVSTINSDTSDYAQDICDSVPGHSWVRWNRQNEIQLIDRQGHVIESVKFNKTIKGITTTRDNRLLACGWDEKCIYRVVYGSEPSVYFSTTLHPYQICSTDSADLLVTVEYEGDTRGSRSTVCRYSSEGQRLSHSADYDRFGEKLFVRPYCLAVNNINTAVAVVNVTSNSRLLSHLVLLDTSLNLKLRYDGKVTASNEKYTPNTGEKFYVEDVTFTPECNILVTEGYSRSIWLLDSDCQPLKKLWKDELEPVSLCLHNDGELWCSFKKERGGVIKVIKLSTRE